MCTLSDPYRYGGQFQIAVVILISLEKRKRVLSVRMQKIYEQIRRPDRDLLLSQDALCLLLVHSQYLYGLCVLHGIAADRAAGIAKDSIAALIGKTCPHEKWSAVCLIAVSAHLKSQPGLLLLPLPINRTGKGDLSCT